MYIEIDLWGGPRVSGPPPPGSDNLLTGCVHRSTNRDHDALVESYTPGGGAAPGTQTQDTSLGGLYELVG